MRLLTGFVTCASLCSAFHLASPIISRAFPFTNSGQYKKFTLFSSPNDAQGAIPEIPNDAELKDDQEIMFQTIRRFVKEDKNLPFVYEDFEGDFVGHAELVEQVATRVSLTLQEKKIESQNSFAFVHTGPNGVGKTFTAMCLPELLQNSTTFAKVDIQFLFAYIGFNGEMDLKNFELVLIETGEVKDQIISQEESIRRIVLSRLILVLMSMIKHNKFYETHTLHAQPMMPINLDGIEPYDNCLKFLLSLDSEKLKKKVNLLCAELTEEIGQSTVIVINLDEVHFLDELVKVQGEPQGARFALQVLREMQTNIFNDQNGTCLLLPFATGINPTTFLDDEAEGQNIGVIAAVVNETDFNKISEQFFADMDMNERKMVVLMTWPRIRALKNYDGVIHPVFSTETYRYYVKSRLVAGFGELPNSDGENGSVLPS